MNNIRILRKQKNMTMKELGCIVNVSEGAVSQYETGKRMPSNDVLIKLANYFNVTVDYLLGRSEYKKMPKGFPLGINEFYEDLEKAGFKLEEYQELSSEEKENFAKTVISFVNMLNSNK